MCIWIHLILQGLIHIPLPTTIIEGLFNCTQILEWLAIWSQCRTAQTFLAWKLQKKWCFPWADKSRKTTMSPSTITLSTCAGVTQISWTYDMKSWSQDLLKALQHLIQTPAGRMHWKNKAGLRDIIIIFFFCYWQPVLGQWIPIIVWLIYYEKLYSYRSLCSIVKFWPVTGKTHQEKHLRYMTHSLNHF